MAFEAQTPRLVGACERQARGFLGGALRCLAKSESRVQKKKRPNRGGGGGCARALAVYKPPPPKKKRRKKEVERVLRTVAARWSGI
jgi:hypothetical protein